MTSKSGQVLKGEDGTAYQIQSVGRTWYRAVGANGKIWSESSDPTKVSEATSSHRAGDEWHPFTFQRLERYVVTASWEEWNP